MDNSYNVVWYIWDITLENVKKGQSGRPHSSTNDESITTVL